MKKTFKFFMCAAIVAAGFVGCSNEEVTPNGGNTDNGGILTKGETSATFAFSVSGSSATKALYPDATSENTNVVGFRVLLYDAGTGDLELDTVKTIAANDSLMTARVISGQKYIYVYVNGPQTSEMGIPANGAITGWGTNNFNPSYRLVTGSPSPYFTDLINMHSLYPAGPTVNHFFYSSTTRQDEQIRTLIPAVVADSSRVPTNQNYVNVNVDRAVAKVSVTKTVPSGPNAGAGEIITLDTLGKITPTSVQYHVFGANVETFPFQKWVSGVLTTPEYLPNQKIDPATPLHYARALGATAANTRIAVATRSGVPTGSFYYVPENNPSSKRKGNTTIAAVEAVYLPMGGSYATAVSYNNASQTFALTKPSANMTAPTDMYLFVLTGILGVPERTLFVGNDAKLLAKKVLYHIQNPNVAELGTLSSYEALIADLAVGVQQSPVANTFEDNFLHYIAGKSYYRLPFGEQSGTGDESTIDPMVRRNYYYDANISAFKQLGENYANKTVEPEDEPVKGVTYLSVHIIIRDWTGKEQNVII